MNDKAGRLLNEALASYSAVEPLAGFEQRILERVRLAERSRRRRWFGWSAAIATGLAGVLAVFILPGQAEHAPVIALRFPRAPEFALRPAPLQHRVGARRPKPAVQTAATAAIPRRNQFPTPVPQTADEHALAVLARQNPEQLQQLSAEPSATEIQAIEIAPLAEGGAEDKERTR